MAQDLLRPKTKKLNYNKTGAGKADKLRKRTEAEARQAAYAKLTTEQKLALPHLGNKERAKLVNKAVRENLKETIK